MLSTYHHPCNITSMYTTHDITTQMLSTIIALNTNITTHPLITNIAQHPSSTQIYVLHTNMLPTCNPPMITHNTNITHSHIKHTYQHLHPIMHHQHHTHTTQHRHTYSHKHTSHVLPLMQHPHPLPHNC